MTAVHCTSGWCSSEHRSPHWAWGGHPTSPWQHPARCHGSTHGPRAGQRRGRRVPTADLGEQTLLGPGRKGDLAFPGLSCSPSSSSRELSLTAGESGKGRGEQLSVGTAGAAALTPLQNLASVELAGGARGVRAVSPAQLLPPPARMCQGRHPSAPASPAHRPGVPSWPGSSCRRAVTGQLRLVSQDAATAETFPTAKTQSWCRARGSLASPSLPHAAPRPRSCSGSRRHRPSLPLPVPWPQNPPRWRCGASLAQPQVPPRERSWLTFSLWLGPCQAFI